MIRCLPLLLAACLLIQADVRPAMGQSWEAETGLPFIQNFSPRDYGAHNQIWDLVQDDRGLMYFATNPGPVEYDGVNWRVIPTANSSFALSIDKDQDGTIYVGAIDEIGFLKPDSLGSLQYSSLLEHLPEEERKLGLVWRTFAHKDGVYFQTFTKLIRLNLSAEDHEDQVRIWKPAEGNRFSLSSHVNNTLYVQELGKGMFVMENDSLQLMPGGDVFKTWQVPVLLPGANEQLLAVTIRNGLFMYDGTTFNRFESEVEPFITEQLRQPSHGVLLPDSTYFLSFVRGGPIHMSSDGRIINILDESDGLRTSDVKKTYVDNQNGLWLGLNNGISRLELPSPFTIFHEDQSFSGNIEIITRHNGDLYLGTNIGLYRMEPASSQGEQPSFSLLPDIATHVWSLADMGQGLLIGASNGLYWLQDESVTLVAPLSSSAAYQLYPSPSNSDLVYVGLTYGLAVLERIEGTWTYKGAYQGFNESVRSIIEDEEGNLWLGTDVHGTLYVEQPSLADVPETTPVITRYAGEHGLPDGIVMPLFVNKQIRFATNNGLRRFDEDSGQFIPDGALGSAFESVQIYRYAVAQDGRYWVNAGGYQKGELGFVYPSEDEVSWTYEPYSRVKDAMGVIRSIYPDSVSNVIWFGGDSGLLRYDPAIEGRHSYSFSSHIRDIKVRNDSLIFGGMQEASLSPVLNYKDDALRFEYSSTSFDLSEMNMYQVRLDPFDKEWGDWTEETQKDYTNLPENKYTFRVRARNAYQTVSAEDAFSFTILPPWYRTWWAFMLYTLLGGAAIYGIIQLRTSQLRNRNLRLELTIEERTQEILRQAEEIKQKNKQLQESIDTLESTQNQLIHAEKMASLGKMATGIAHEIKNPLNFVTNFSNINEQLIEELSEELGQKLDTSTLKDYDELKSLLDDLKINSQSITKHGQRADSIVVSLMQHASGGKGNKEEQHINSLLNESTDLVAQLTTTQRTGVDVSFVKQLDTNAGTAVINQSELQRVLINLLDNAVDAVVKRAQSEPEGFKPEITIASRAGKGYIEIQVSDNGSGIPDKIRHQIFEPFFTTKPTGSGTGLGLSLSYEIITQGHGGSIELLKQDTPGSTFLIRLPKDGRSEEPTDPDPAS